MTRPPTAPMGVYLAAREWAAQHCHQTPDDRLVNLIYAAGRRAAAEDIRDAPYPDPSLCLPAWHAGYEEATATAARVAEVGIPSEPWS